MVLKKERPPGKNSIFVFDFYRLTADMVEEKGDPPLNTVKQR